MIILIVSLGKRNRCGTTIILEVTSGTSFTLIPLLSLPLCPSLLEINPPSSITNMTLAKLPSFNLINFTVTNKLQHSTIGILTNVTLSIANRLRVSRIMKQPYMAFILLQHGRITMPIPNMTTQKCFDYFKN